MDNLFDIVNYLLMFVLGIALSSVVILLIREVLPSVL